ncbi:hypothetical protein FHT03_000931 [Xanthomonas arboricola]|uniref:hypothetical protein n=1 Tax=Xanthomonas cannabis TaxID=1885674 RepID=UPI0018580EB9|nr:hypothetical protein [Xanthomonas cannabis]MBB3805953.1 hypothetical protein [Xanthomonas cannabis]
MLDHAGSVRIGQEFAGLAPTAAWQRDESLTEGCDYVREGALPRSVAMMVLDGRIVRFDISAAGAIGPYGIRVGDSEAVVRSRLPAGYSVEPHFYGGRDDHYLTWRDPRHGLAVRYETGEGHVTSMYWGRWGAVQFVEGCL